MTATSANTFTQRGVPSSSCIGHSFSIHSVSVKSECLVPKLWNESVEAHRRDVRDAILDATAALVEMLGISGVSMSQIAEDTGIGRATLYKYFTDVESILVAWHERQVMRHLHELVAVRDRGGGALEKLEAVLAAFAMICHEHHHSELAGLLHGGEHVARAQHRLTELVRELVTEGAEAGELRSDVGAHELATYCLYALAAASSLPSKAAVRRLVAVTVAGLRPD